VRLARALHWSPGNLTTILIFTAAVIPFLGWSGLVVLNGKWDAHPTTSHVVKIYDRIESSGFGLNRHYHRPKYYLLVQSWHDPDARLEIRVTQQLYRQDFYGGYLLKITTGRGRFGIEWTTSMVLVKKPEPSAS